MERGAIAHIHLDQRREIWLHHDQPRDLVLRVGVSNPRHRGTMHTAALDFLQRADRARFDLRLDPVGDRRACGGLER
jgi:hypothetical protein